MAQVVSAARVVVQNGVGYDTYMNNIEAASPSSSRKVIDVQKLLGLPDSTPNPHLWYKPSTMPAVAKALAGDLSAIQPVARRLLPGQRDQVRQLAEAVVSRRWRRSRSATRRRPVATTEPVGDYMLAAAGAVNLTPFSFQADIMNGVDPAPQAVTLENSLFSQHRVKVFLYNQQVTSSLTETFLAAAKKYGIPVVGVYETMPTRLQLPVVDARRGDRACRRRSPTRSPRRSCERRSDQPAARGADPLGRAGQRQPGRPRGAARGQLRDRRRASSPG